MTTFKVGDKVRRKNHPHGSLSVGGVGTVLVVTETGGYRLAEDMEKYPDHSHSKHNLELVETAAKPTHPMLLSEDAQARKGMPITSGVLDYFPKALAMVAMCSKAGNDQHNPGQPLHWDKSKSGDHVDCIARHLIDRKSLDTDGIPHAVKLAWRALANLETMIENGEVKL